MTKTIQIPGGETMHFEFGALVAGETIDAPANRVMVEHHVGGHFSSRGHLSRTAARRWWADAIAAGGKVVA